MTRAQHHGRLLLLMASLAVVRGALAGYPDPLQPDELLLIYNRDDPRSRDLAKYYATQRNVPADRQCPVRAEVNREETSRALFDEQIRLPVREYLEQHQLRDRVRCLVTFYGLPIRVGPKIASPDERRVAARWRQELVAATGELAEAAARLEALGTDADSSSPSAAGGDLQAVRARYQQARAAVWQRLMPRFQRGEAAKEYQVLVEDVRNTEGTAAIVSSMQPAAGAPAEEARDQIGKLLAAVKETDARILELRRLPLTDPKREEARPLIRQNHGLIGLLASLETDIAQTETAETVSALDSELMLLWWDDYPLYRWVHNTGNWRIRTSPAWRASLPPAYWSEPTLMVSRIDGPSMSVAQRLIDDAIAAEREGIDGVVYLDSRGINDDEGHGVYDGNLRGLAALLWKRTTLRTRLDKRAEVFGPGRCPETMLYCGWYSLRQYVHSFEFVRGAVGYHIASFEAISLKDPDERGWCKNLLADGIAVTMGPVAEPYLRAFPEPLDFFGLLFTGRFSVAECYLYSANFNSWMMMLIGDPLYRPFARKPLLTLEDVYPPEAIPEAFRSVAASRPETK